MILHYKLMVGLISLSETVHKIAHNGRLFIPVDRVLGRYQVFLTYYEHFCNPEQLETLKRIEKYTQEQSDLLDTTILEQNYVNYNINDQRFVLPEAKIITSDMINQIEAIKNNNYLLPVAPDYNTQNKKEIICPIYFE